MLLCDGLPTLSPSTNAFHRLHLTRGIARTHARTPRRSGTTSRPQDWPEDGVWWAATTGALLLKDTGQLQQNYRAIISEEVA